MNTVYIRWVGVACTSIYKVWTRVRVERGKKGHTLLATLPYSPDPLKHPCYCHMVIYRISPVFNPFASSIEHPHAQHRVKLSVRLARESQSLSYPAWSHSAAQPHSAAGGFILARRGERTQNKCDLRIAVLALRTFRGHGQYHGFHPAKDQPSTHGSVACSTRQSTCCSSDSPACGSVRRRLPSGPSTTFSKASICAPSCQRRRGKASHS